MGDLPLIGNGPDRVLHPGAAPCVGRVSARRAVPGQHESSGSDGTDTGFGDPSIQGQRYASDGSAQGDQFQVNTYTTSEQAFSSVAANAAGKFVVVWESYGSDGTDDSRRSVHGQRFAADGSPQGPEFQVNSHTTDNQIYSDVTLLTDGDFVVVWEHEDWTDSSNSGVRAQRYTSDGSPLGNEFQVNTYTTGIQRSASVAALPAGRFVVAWTSEPSPGTDTSYGSIQGQRFVQPPAVPALSNATRFALGAVMLLGAAHALRRRAAR